MSGRTNTRLGQRRRASAQLMGRPHPRSGGPRSWARGDHPAAVRVAAHHDRAAAQLGTPGASRRAAKNASRSRWGDQRDRPPATTATTIAPIPAARVRTVARSQPPVKPSTSACASGSAASASHQSRRGHRRPAVDQRGQRRRETEEHADEHQRAGPPARGRGWTRRTRPRPTSRGDPHAVAQTLGQVQQPVVCVPPTGTPHDGETAISGGTRLAASGRKAVTANTTRGRSGARENSARFAVEIGRVRPGDHGAGARPRRRSARSAAVRPDSTRARGGGRDHDALGRSPAGRRPRSSGGAAAAEPSSPERVSRVASAKRPRVQDVAPPRTTWSGRRRRMRDPPRRAAEPGARASARAVRGEWHRQEDTIPARCGDT